MLTEFIERADIKAGPYSAAAEITEATNTLSDLTRHWFADPTALAEAQASLVRSYADLWNNVVRRMFGQDVTPVAEPEPGDNRFKDPEWSQNPYFDFWKQSYLITSRWADDLLDKTEGLDERTRQKAEFYLRQVSSALSPSNFPMTNPEVLRETLKSNAENLVKGMSYLAEDMSRSGDLLRISQTDASAFEVGRNLATTPGKVIYQNDLLQLIQYAPSTEKVRELPLLIVPPWINKFYILDLAPAKSLIKFLVDQGLTVFMVSWVNPDGSLSHKSFEDYMQEGILTAADAVRRETGPGAVQCRSAIASAARCWRRRLPISPPAARSRSRPRASSRRRSTSQHAGDLLLFTDADQLEALNELMSERGYLDGSRMANVFNMLRPTRPDLALHRQQLPLGQEAVSVRPALLEPELDADGCRQPQFLFERVLWRQPPRQQGDDARRHAARSRQGQATGLRARHQGGPHRAGEIGIRWRRAVRRPGRVRAVGLRPHRRRRQPARQDQVSVLDQREARKSLEEWVETAEEHPGSWWPHWAEWLAKRSGDWIEPREPGKTLGVIEDAPGSYVKAKV